MSMQAVRPKKAAKHEGRAPMTFKKALQRYWVLYIMLFVIMAYYCLFHYYTIYLGIQMAFRKVKLGMAIMDAKWVGFENFQKIFKNKEIIQTVINTLRMSVSRLVWTFWPPIVLAVMLFDLTSATYKRVCQTLVYIPHFFSWVVVYGIVYSLFASTGLLNTFLGQFGIGPIDF